jgi:hypothetical protein
VRTDPRTAAPLALAVLLLVPADALAFRVTMEPGCFIWDMTATPTDTPSLYAVTGIQQNTCDLPPEFPAEPLPLPIKGYAVAHPGALIVFHVVLMTPLWNVPYVAVVDAGTLHGVLGAVVAGDLTLAP